ncbi:MAG: porin family protein [Gammaproteobacteria bacterium]|nr:porin family protein [Gammaproteobacteria bacterium]
MIRKISLLTFSLLITANVSAKEFSYNYVEAAYGMISDSSLGVDIDGTGIGFGGSFDITPVIAATVSYEVVSYDTYAGIDVDTTALQFGITGHTSISPKADVFANFSIISAEIELSNGFSSASDDDTGNVISAGLRYEVQDNFELDAGFTRTDVFDDSSLSIGFGARFYTDNQLSFRVGYSTGDDVDTITLSARYNLK